jgi:uncharacterized membrane protein
MQLITSTFSNKHRATEVLSDLEDLDLDWGIPVEQAAVALSVNKHGKVRVHQMHEAASAGALMGGMTGFLAGLLVFAPGVGAAIGTATGAAIGAIADPEPIAGVDKNFLKSLGDNLARDSSALIVLVSDDDGASALATVKTFTDGVIAEAAVDTETEQAIRVAYDNLMG